MRFWICGRLIPNSASCPRRSTVSVAPLASGTSVRRVSPARFWADAGSARRNDTTPSSVSSAALDKRLRRSRAVSLNMNEVSACGPAQGGPRAFVRGPIGTCICAYLLQAYADTYVKPGWIHLLEAHRFGFASAEADGQRVNVSLVVPRFARYSWSGFGSRSYQAASSPGWGSTWPYSTMSVGVTLQR